MPVSHDQMHQTTKLSTQSAGGLIPSTTYRQLLFFLLPLALTVIVLQLGMQFLNGGMARMPRATETLATYGLAWGIVLFLASPLMQVKQLSLVLVNNRHDFWTVLRFVLAISLLLAGVLASLALGPMGTWVVDDLHGVEPSLGTAAREALLWLVPFPVLRGLTLFFTGLLIRIRRTDLASYAALANIGTSIVVVFALLPSSLVRYKPVSLPILVTYAGILVELGIVWWSHRRYGSLASARLPGQTAAGGSVLTFSYVFRFFWPLALIMGIQGLSRPLINLFISREPAGAAALAALTIVYPLANLAYGWVNEIRNLPAAFRDQKDSPTYIRRFALACGLFSFGLMLILFWTPLRDFILQTLLGLGPLLAAKAAVPLMIFSFFPLVVMVRAYLHGIGLQEHRTQAMAPSAPSRILAILVALLLLPLLGAQGAARGVAALLCGFVVETLVLWWGVRRGRWARHLKPADLASGQ